VQFIFTDLRDRYPESRARARELGLYVQKYCGCVFSALERAEGRAGRAVARALGYGEKRCIVPDARTPTVAALRVSR